MLALSNFLFQGIIRTKDERSDLLFQGIIRTKDESEGMCACVHVF